MPEIHNSELTKELIDGGKIQTAYDPVPKHLAEKVVPVMEVNPKILQPINIFVRGSSAASGTSTIYTTPTDKDFFLCGVSCDMNSDAAADNTYYVLQATLQDGTTLDLRWQKTTLTAFNKTAIYNFPKPIKLKKGSTVTIGTTFTVGAATKDVTIWGYLVNNIKA